jgi:hypothetical protein
VATNPHQNTETDRVRKPRRVILANHPAMIRSSIPALCPPTAVSGNAIMLFFLPIHETQELKQGLGIN